MSLWDNRGDERGCTKVIDMLTQEDFHGAFQKLLERYIECIAAGGDYFEGDYSFMFVLSIKVPIRKQSGNLFNSPCTFKVIPTKLNMEKYKNQRVWWAIIKPKIYLTPRLSLDGFSQLTRSIEELE